MAVFFVILGFNLKNGAKKLMAQLFFFVQKSNPPSSGAYSISHQRHQPSDQKQRSVRHYSDRNREDEQSRPHKLKPEHYSDRNHEDERINHHSNHRPETTYNDHQQKSNIFSRISFSAEEEAIAKKKKKASSSTTESMAHVSNGYYEVRKDDDDCSDDDERHFKRRRSRYELVDSRERKHRWRRVGIDFRFYLLKVNSSLPIHKNDFLSIFFFFFGLEPVKFLLFPSSL